MHGPFFVKGVNMSHPDGKRWIGEGDGMDTTYVTIMLVVFLVITGLAVDIGYLYVGEEDLQSAAESAALAGAQAMKHRLLVELKAGPERVAQATTDPVQREGRLAAMETASGKHAAAALIELKNDDVNALTADNDITVGFWNMTGHSYSAGATPVNAIQVRTRRTAESNSVGMGNLGSFLAKISGTDSFASTPVAIASLVTGATANFALCGEVLDRGCSYPKICSVPERKLNSDEGTPSSGRYLYTPLLHPMTALESLSQLICTELPPQEVCGRPIFVTKGSRALLADLAAMLYDPAVDPTNKEYDLKGTLLGWWTMVPVSDCTPLRPGEAFDTRRVSRYALVRLTRICAGGARGCRDSGRMHPVPASACQGGGEGIYLDRIAGVGCGRDEAVKLPGLKAVLVK